MICLEDEWDETAQITSTVELLLDSYYRTMEGFRMLIQREWQSMGHRFTRRINLQLMIKLVLRQYFCNF